MKEKRTELFTSLLAVGVSYYALHQGLISGREFTGIIIALGLGYTTSRTIIKSVVAYLLPQEGVEKSDDPKTSDDTLVDDGRPRIDSIM